MENPESATGVLFICGAIMFLAGCMFIRILHALDEDDKYRKEHKE
jgi:hypothetical protein